MYSQIHFCHANVHFFFFPFCCENKQDVLINNAGIVSGKTFLDTTDEALERTVQVHMNDGEKKERKRERANSKRDVRAGKAYGTVTGKGRERVPRTNEGE